jgi:hypothetical protein
VGPTPPKGGDFDPKTIIDEFVYLDTGYNVIETDAGITGLLLPAEKGGPGVVVSQLFTETNIVSVIFGGGPSNTYGAPAYEEEPSEEEPSEEEPSGGSGDEGPVVGTFGYDVFFDVSTNEPIRVVINNLGGATIEGFITNYSKVNETFAITFYGNPQEYSLNMGDAESEYIATVDYLEKDITLNDSQKLRIKNIFIAMRVISAIQPSEESYTEPY